MYSDKRIQRALRTHGKGLDPSESILWADSAFLVLTDARLVSFYPVNSRDWVSSGPVPSFSVLLGDIDLNFTPVSKGLKLQIRLKSGRLEEISMANLSPKDTLELMESMRRAAISPKTIEGLETISSENRNEIEAKAKAARQLAKESQKIEDARAKDEKKRIKEKEKADFEAKYGSVVVSEPFATKWITIYSNGYVKVSGGMGILQGSVEKLVDIFGETDITKKTGLGRAAGAILTMGANVALSPNQRGNVYLTIATDRETYSILWERPDQASIRTMNRLVSAGKAALARSAHESREPYAPKASTGQQGDLVSQLANLAQLRDTGVLSEQEFERAKAKLLG